MEAEMINTPGMKCSKMGLVLQHKQEGVERKSKKFDDMMTKSSSK